MYRMLPPRTGLEAYSYTTHISNSGYVAGAYLASSEWRPYIWNGESGTHDLVGLANSTRTVSAVNDEGQAVGSSYVNIGAYGGSRPVLWDTAGNPSDLGTLGGFFGNATDINSVGQVVGQAECGDRTSHAFLWNPVSGRMQDLGSLSAGWSEADALNDLGEVTGVSYTGSEVHLFRWTSSSGMCDLGTLDRQHTRMCACDMNELGQIVGSTGYRTFGGTRAWVYDVDGYLDLGLSGAVASGISDRGQVVGWFRDTNEYEQAFLWDKTNGISILGTPEGYIQSHAVSINDNGWIVGVAWDENGYYDVMWEPVPEPTGLVGLCAGLFCLATRIRRRKP